MTAGISPRPDRGNGLALLGGIGVVAGFIAYVLELSSIDIASWLGGSGWTLFIIVPGVLLIAAAVVLREGQALATTIAGAVVTTVGLLLLYQDQTSHYESWAYLWTLIPMAVGLALAVHGLRVGAEALVSKGIRLVAGFGAVLLVAAWYFETIFRTNKSPFDLGENWPIALIVVGGLLLVGGLLRGSIGGENDTP
jgi:hypothetical protein